MTVMTDVRYEGIYGGRVRRIDGVDTLYLFRKKNGRGVIVPVSFVEEILNDVWELDEAERSARYARLK
jgi:hypothetical protein